MYAKIKAVRTGMKRSVFTQPGIHSAIFVYLKAICILPNFSIILSSAK